MQERLSEVFSGSKDFAGYSKDYFNHLKKMLDGLDSKELESLLLALLEAKENERMIFFLGNGGSASSASHYANDLCKFASKKGKKFKALSLSDNISWFSALANDEGYETVFVSQLENFVKKGDLVIGISSSGNSKNIINAFDLAKKKEAVSIAIVGFDGGEMLQIADKSLHIKSEKGEYGPVEDIHMIINHLISSYISFLSERDK